MSEFSDNARSLIEALSKFYEQIALLLRAADTIFDEQGWRSEKTAITGSNSLDWPSHWLARVMHRFYRPEEERLQHIVPFVSVIISDHERDDRTPVPLLTAGYFEYDGTAKPDYMYWFARMFVWMENAAADGRLAQADHRIFNRTKVPWNRVTVLAIPLENITTTEILRSTLQPILSAIRDDDGAA